VEELLVSVLLEEGSTGPGYGRGMVSPSRHPQWGEVLVPASGASATSRIGSCSGTSLAQRSTKMHKGGPSGLRWGSSLAQSVGAVC
jgi:hypothetical protein